MPLTKNQLVQKYLVDILYNTGTLFASTKLSKANISRITKHQNTQGTVDPYDIKIIQHLIKGIKYILNYHGEVNLKLLHDINKIVAFDALDPGYFATQPMLVNGIKWHPPVPSTKRANQFIKKYLHDSNHSKLINILSLMLVMDRYQFFWDGNKRTNYLMANYYLLKHHLGLLIIDKSFQSKWDSLLSKFYESGNLKAIIPFLVHHCIYGK